MIIVKLMGGLGNQMFQYALGITRAKANNTDLLLDLTYYDAIHENDTPRNFALDNYNIDYKKAENKDLLELKYPNNGVKNISKNILNLFFNKKKYFNYIEKKFSFNEIVNNHADFVYYNGYWQCEKYFIDNKEKIFNDFTLKNQISDLCLEYKKKIESQESVGIHIRRGDYITNPKAKVYHGLCDLSYYSKAIEHIDSKINNPSYFIFSDDIIWAKENFNDKKFAFIEPSNTISDVDELYLMSLCKHNIIANSSFSWWSAWLNKNKEKIVIAPKKWFNNQSVDTSDLIPDKWIRM